LDRDAAPCLTHELPITYHPAMLFGPAVRSAKPLW
jgi:hypothetical protein